MILDAEPGLEMLARLLDEESTFVWDVETTGTDIFNVRKDDRIIGHAFYFPKADRALYIPIRHEVETEKNVPMDALYAVLEPAFTNLKTNIIGHNICQFDLKMIEKDVPWVVKAKLWDTLPLAHLDDENHPRFEHFEVEGVAQWKHKNAPGGGLVTGFRLKEDLGFDYLGADALEEKRAMKKVAAEAIERHIAAFVAEHDDLKARLEAAEKSWIAEKKAPYNESLRQLRKIKRDFEKEGKDHAVENASRSIVEMTCEREAVSKLKLRGDPGTDGDFIRPEYDRLDDLAARIKAARKREPMSMLAELPLAVVAEYAMKDCTLNWRLFRTLWCGTPDGKPKGLVPQKLNGLAPEICDYATVLSRMESRGLLIDREKVEAQIAQSHVEQEKLKLAAWEAAGEEFNINSVPQISRIIGQKETNHEALAECEHPVAQFLVAYRSWGKVRSTYYERILNSLDPEGVSHPSFRTAATVSGRLADDMWLLTPREKDMFSVRSSVIARPGFKLLEGDYASLEMRLMAHFSNESSLIKIINDGGDPHRMTADAIGLPKTKEGRQAGKQLGFATIYGAGPDGLVHALGLNKVHIIRDLFDGAMSEAQIRSGEAYWREYCQRRRFVYSSAKTAHETLHRTECAIANDFLKAYKSRFPKIAEYVRKKTKEAKDYGRIRVWTGRIRHYPREPWGYSKTHTAINNDIQTSAAELFRRGALRTESFFEARREQGGIAPQFLLFVHDSALTEVPENDVEHWAREIKRGFELKECFAFRCPIRMDFKIGVAWGDMEAYEVD